MNGPSPMPADPASARLTRFERAGLILVGLAFVAFGGLVLLRSAFQTDRKTDFGVYARGGYAVRAGLDLYDANVCDDRGWHFCYPPPFSIFMTPLADPFVWVDRAGYLPFWASVAIWYALSVGLLAYAVHALAGAALPDAVRGSRRWWYARAVPVYVCLGGIGFTLSRGQVNTLLLALLTAMFLAAVRRRTVRSGVWLAAAAALKVIPAFLILFPFTRFLRPGGRREAWVWAGVGIGLAGLLLALPAAVWGWDGAVANNRRFAELVLLPATVGGGDQTRAKELTSATTTDSQSFQVVLHNLRYRDPKARPEHVDRVTKLAHLAICGGLVLATLWVGGRRLGPDPADQLVYFGCLCLLMVLISPASHVHYYVLGIPITSGLWAKSVAGRPGRVFADRRVMTVLAAWGVVVLVVLLPYRVTVVLREIGLAVVATVALWAYGLAVVAGRPAVSAEDELPGLPELAPRASAASRAA